MWFWFLKKSIRAIAVGVLAIGICCCVRMGNATKLSAYVGENTYYLRSSSSQALQKTSLTPWECLLVQGESVQIRGQVDERFVQRIAAEQDAEIVFVEEVCGVKSYYCYTPNWQESVYLSGRRVNLHIALQAQGCVVGYPVIFGGY